MLARTAVAFLLAALALALCAGGAGAALPSLTRCDRGVDLGFTTARVAVRHMTCVRGREIVRKWRRKVARIGDGPAPPHTTVVGYSCRFGGTELQLTLRCTKDRKRVRATWGG